VTGISAASNGSVLVVAKRLNGIELDSGVRFATEDSYLVIDEDPHPHTERKTSPGGGVLDLENCETPTRVSQFFSTACFFQMLFFIYAMLDNR